MLDRQIIIMDAIWSDHQIIMGAHQKMTEMQPINYRLENLIHLLHNLFVGPFFGVFSSLH